MPTPRPQLHADHAGHPPAWMKFAFGFMCALVGVVALIGWEQWDDASRDYAAKQHELKLKSDQNAKALRERDGLEEFLIKYNQDPEFRLRVARQRLQYAAPGEVILRMDPPPRVAPAAHPPERKQP